MHETLLDVPHGDRPALALAANCPRCKEALPHRRVLSLPAPYLGERVRNPCVRGGAFDTMGNAPVPALPDLPAGVESNTENYRQLFASTEWQEARSEVKEVNRRNARKRKRAAALERGENINMRRDKCDGDPKMTG